jgi:hypothetical protein
MVEGLSRDKRSSLFGFFTRGKKLLEIWFKCCKNIFSLSLMKKPINQEQLFLASISSLL